MRALIVVLILMFQIGLAQTGSVGALDGRSTGIGKTGVVSSRGIAALWHNPANLSMYNGDHRFEIWSMAPAPNLNVRLGTDFLTIDEYNYFFGGETNSKGETVSRYLTESDKNRLRDAFEGGGFFVSDFSFNLFGVALRTNHAGTFAFNITDVIAGKVNFPVNFVNIAIDGNKKNFIYDFNETDLKFWWLRKYAVSYALSMGPWTNKIFKSFAFGFSLNFISGFTYIGLDNIHTEIGTDQNNNFVGKGDYLAYSAFSPDFNVKYDFDPNPKKKGSIGPFPSAAGSGFGFDFGFFAEINDKWSAGISFMDLGSVTWDKNAAKFSSNQPIFLDDITSKSQRDSLVDALSGRGELIDEFTTSLPGAFHLGVALNLHEVFGKDNFEGKTILTFDYLQGFNNQPRNSTSPRFGFGVEWKPDSWIPYLRMGMNFGGADKFGWTAGMGIDFGFLEINFATPDFQYFFMPAQAKRVSFSANNIWKF